MTRPASVVATLVVVLLHATLQLGRTVASVVSLTAFVLAHPGFEATPFLLFSSASGALLGLVVATGDVVLGLWFFRGAPRARLVLSLWLALSGLATLGGVVSLSVAAASPTVSLFALSFVQLALCVAALVLLWFPPTTAWLRTLPVRPA